MSATVVGATKPARVTASVTELCPPGARCQLYAVDSRGMTILVTQWVAGNTPYTYAGDVAAPANDLGCSTVIQLDGRVTIAGKAARSG